MGILGVAFMAFMGTVFLFPATPRTSVPEMNYAVVVTAGVLIFSLAWYYCPKYGGVYWFTGPVRNIDVVDESSKATSELDGSEERGDKGTK